MELILFYLLAVVAITAALLVVLQRRAVYSALSLIVCFGAMAGLFFQLGALFLAAIQVILYAGAIMVLFLFSIMLLDPKSEIFAANRLKAVTIGALPLAGFFTFVLFRAFKDAGGPPSQTPLGGETEVIAYKLFGDYLLPFEITSILIMVAIVGAVVLAKRPG
ncbi:MAG: NADH-quinone oxidoreductase subunit J [Acidobacteriota bacterium]